MGSPWPSQAPYEKHHFSDLLKRTAERLPDKTVFIGGDESTYTFGQVWDAAQRTARLLQDEAGVKKGETTAILAPNCPEYAVALHGSLLTGAKVTTLNPLYKEREVQHQLEDADAVVAGGGDDAVAVRAEERRAEQPGIARLQNAQTRAGLSVPEARGVILGRGRQHPAPAGTEGHGGDGLVMPFEQHIRPLGATAPDTRRIVRGCGQKRAPVGTEGNREHLALVAAQLELEALPRDVPYQHALALVRGRRQAAVLVEARPEQLPRALLALQELAT